jgi:hypothetical protein
MKRLSKPLKDWSKAELAEYVEHLESLQPLDDQGKRDAEIVTKRWRGATEPELAAEYGITKRRIRQIIDQWRIDHAGLRLRAANDPSAVVDELIENYEATAGWFAEIARKADNTAAAVGALRGRIEVLDKIATLLQASGALPHDLGKLRLEIDVKYVAEVLVAVLERHDVPIEAQAEVLETLSESTGLALTKGG